MAVPYEKGDVDAEKARAGVLGERALGFAAEAVDGEGEADDGKERDGKASEDGNAFSAGVAGDRFHEPDGVQENDGGGGEEAHDVEHVETLAEGEVGLESRGGGSGHAAPDQRVVIAAGAVAFGGPWAAGL